MTTESNKKKRMEKFVQPADGIHFNAPPIDYDAFDKQGEEQAEKVLAKITQSSKVSEH